VFFFKFGLPKVNPPKFWHLCRNLHRIAEEAKNTVKEVLSNYLAAVMNWGKMDLDDSTIENMCSDMTASIEGVEWHEIKISVYQADICTNSHDMLLLYSGSSDIEVGPLLLGLKAHIFDCLESVLHQLVERTSEDLEGIIDIFC
jgi:hypothetical protein